VQIGIAEATSGGWQVFGAVAKADTDIEELIGRSLDGVVERRGNLLVMRAASASAQRLRPSVSLRPPRY